MVTKSERKVMDETNERLTRASFMAGWDDAWVMEYEQLTAEMFAANLVPKSRGNAVTDQIDAFYLALVSKNADHLRVEVDRMSCSECDWLGELERTICPSHPSSKLSKTKIFIDRLTDKKQWNLRAENLIERIKGNTVVDV